ncbi:RibD family protein [Jannaschia sp. R86511]|uniref:RibD family protein n=1 Tax=Jannaschia sp. R86511 TaxID=3093853 RepID=UPI0036D35400
MSAVGGDPVGDVAGPVGGPRDRTGVSPVGPADPGGSALYAPLRAGGPRYAVAQLGQSLDGCIATRTGDAEFVTGEADRAHLHQLRAYVDAVVVGVGTVVSDDPRLTVRAVRGDDPHRVVLDPSARCPRTARVLADGAGATWVVGRAAAGGLVDVPAGVRLLVLPTGDDGRFAPAGVLDALAGLGLGRVLVEGGGRTVSAFLRAGVLDRLHLSVAPVLLGTDGTTGIGVPGPALARDAVRPPSRAFRLGDDVCFDLDLRAAGPGPDPRRGGPAAGQQQGEQTG